MRLVLLIALLILAALVYVVVVRTTRPGPRAAAVPQSVVAKVSEVKELAWDHRDLDPELAGAIIERVRVFQSRPTRDVLDDLLEVAWTHREAAPALSAILIDTIRRDGGAALE